LETNVPLRPYKAEADGEGKKVGNLFERGHERVLPTPEDIR
jgi:hypothetical protein